MDGTVVAACGSVGRLGGGVHSGELGCESESMRVHGFHTGTSSPPGRSSGGILGDGEAAVREIDGGGCSVSDGGSAESSSEG